MANDVYLLPLMNLFSKIQKEKLDNFTSWFFFWGGGGYYFNLIILI